MQDQLLQLMKDNGKPNRQFSLDNICLFSFDKGLFMPHFPKGVELPKYDKYLGTLDPQDHLREFGALSMEFIHDQNYLMHFFLCSLRGSSMEWFSRLPIGIKTFDEITNLFYNITYITYKIQLIFLIFAT